jgi:hypothetical protein
MRPLAWGLRAAIQAIPAASSARPSSCSRRPPGELLGERRHVAAAPEDPVAVGVDAERQALAQRGLAERLEVPRGILLVPEGPARHVARGVVDPADQGQPRPPALEPVVAAPVDLEEQARLGHPLPAGAMAPRAPGPGRGQARLGEDPAQGPLRDDDPLPLGEQVGEVGPVGARVRGGGELEEAGAGLVVEAVGGDPAPVAVDERGGRAVGAIRREEAPNRPDRQLEIGRRHRGRDLPGEQVVEDVQAVLGTSVQGDRLPLHGGEGDKVAGRLWVTDSLAVHTGRHAR